jgi:hypothetical protein
MNTRYDINLQIATLLSLVKTHNDGGAANTNKGAEKQKSEI